MKKSLVILFSAIMVFATVLPVYAEETVEPEQLVNGIEEELAEVIVEEAEEAEELISEDDSAILLGDTYGDFEYEIEGNRIRITGYNGAGGDVVIPGTIHNKTVTEIDAEVFKGNKSVTSISIPAGVTSIGREAFRSCEKLTSVTFAERSKLRKINPYVFSETPITSITIPASVTSIEYSAFEKCKKLTSVSFVNGSELGAIKRSAFAGCEKLTNVAFPEGSELVVIGADAFGRTALTSFTIPSRVAAISGDAFRFCTNLQRVIAKPVNPPELSQNVFDQCADNLTIYVAAGQLNTYKSDPYWLAYEGRLSECRTIHVIPDERGSVEVDADKEAVVPGDEVIITVAANKGYELATISCATGSQTTGTPVALRKIEENKFRFTMPDDKVTIYATWKGDGSNSGSQPSGGSASAPVFTGSTDNPVTNGNWKMNADGTWTFATSRTFTNTWGFIRYTVNGAPVDSWFWFDKNGRMLTGWQQLYWNGKLSWFYFHELHDGMFGACQLGGKTPDGYTLNPDGSWAGF